MAEWDYSEPDYLNELVKYIGNNCQLSASLTPVELVDSIEGEAIAKRENIIPELEGKLVKKGEKLNDEQINALYFLSLCKKYDICPFYYLTLKPYSAPEISYHGPKWRNTIAMDELQELCTEPWQFSKQKRWYGVSFRDFINKSVEGAKIAIKEFSDNGYKLMHIHTDLNPRVVTRDHYYDEFESDLSVFAGGGRINIYNNIPKGFEFPTTKKELENFFNK